MPKLMNKKLISEIRDVLYRKFLVDKIRSAWDINMSRYALAKCIIDLYLIDITMSEELFGYVNSSELYGWSEAQPSDTYLKKQFKSGYSSSAVENTNNSKEQIKLCALCNLVPYYPISTRCGHVYCPPCVWREFNESYQSNTRSDIKIA